MRILLTLLTAICFTLIACGEGTAKAKRRERGTLSKVDYDKLKALNAMLTDNEDAVAAAVAPNAMISEKASKMAAKIESNCKDIRSKLPSKDFHVDWDAIQHVQGTDSCPIFSSRTWSYRIRPEWRELNLSHVFSTKKGHDDFLKQTGVVNISAKPGRILATPDRATGEVRFRGGIVYDTFVLATGERLEAQVQTNQVYRGDSGRGSIMVTIKRPGGVVNTGGVTWDARDFSNRRYFAENGDIDHKSFLELFSFFRVDEIIDNSEGMR